MYFSHSPYSFTVISKRYNFTLLWIWCLMLTPFFSPATGLLQVGSLPLGKAIQFLLVFPRLADYGFWLLSEIRRYKRKGEAGKFCLECYCQSRIAFWIWQMFKAGIFLICSSLVVSDMLSFCSKLRSCLSLWTSGESLPVSCCWVPLVPLGSLWMTYSRFPDWLLHKTHPWPMGFISCFPENKI